MADQNCTDCGLMVRPLRSAQGSREGLGCRPLLDLRVSVTGGVHFDLVKRVLRDINRSGQAPAEIIQQVGKTQARHRGLAEGFFMANIKTTYLTCSLKAAMHHHVV